MTARTTDEQTPIADMDDLRACMVDELAADGSVTGQAVRAALLTVPRHQFMPAGTAPQTAYGAYDSVVTKRDSRGRAMSSVSAPWLQALMIEQAQLRAGMRVLEVGSGGYNAALIAEVVGPTGRVVSIDIDPDVTDRAARLLDVTGYGTRVRVLQADGHHGVPDEAPFDAVIVTVGAWDIAPAWVQQLTPDGTLVLPLVMGGITRSIAFGRDGDRLASLSAEVCGFVDMQGVGSHPDHVVTLVDETGAGVDVRFDKPPHGLALPADILTAPPVEQWSGITIGDGVSWADMYLWFVCHMSGFCRFDPAEDSLMRRMRSDWFPYGLARAETLAHLVVRRRGDEPGVEFGARGLGPDGDALAGELVTHIRDWDRRARHTAPPTFGYVPGATETHRDGREVWLPKTHGSVIIQWPAV